MTTSSDSLSIPARVVGPGAQSWVKQGTAYHRREGGGSPHTWEELRDLGAVPVVPAPRADVERLCAALLAAGPRAAASLIVGVLRAQRHLAGGPDGPGGDRLWAARPTSWPTHVLQRLLIEPGERWQADPDQFDAAAAATAGEVVLGWVTDEDRYVEVAGNLAEVMAEVIERAGGWERVCREQPENDPVVGYLTSRVP